MLRYRLLLIFIVFSSCCAPVSGLAELNPQEIVVLVNTKSPASIHLGNVYAELRGVPAPHVIRMTVDERETISRKDYDELIAKPVRRAVNRFYDKGEKVRCLVATYGVPLKITAVKPLIMPVDDIEKQNRALSESQRELTELQEQKGKSKAADKEVNSHGQTNQPTPGNQRGNENRKRPASGRAAACRINYLGRPYLGEYSIAHRAGNRIPGGII